MCSTSCDSCCCAAQQLVCHSSFEVWPSSRDIFVAHLAFVLSCICRALPNALLLGRLMLCFPVALLACPTHPSVAYSYEVLLMLLHYCCVVLALLASASRKNKRLDNRNPLSDTQCNTPRSCCCAFVSKWFDLNSCFLKKQ